MHSILFIVSMNFGFVLVSYLLIDFIKSTSIYNRLHSRIKGKYYVMRSQSKKAERVKIHRNAIIKNPDRICFGNNVYISRGAELFPLGGGYPSNIVIGNNVHIGDYDRFASAYEVQIDDNVLFAAYVHITDHSHEYRNVNLPVIKQGIFSKGKVHICQGCWIGLRSEILSGVTIGKNSVVAAGSVVTKDVPPYSVVAGVPAKVIKHWDFSKKEWI